MLQRRQQLSGHRPGFSNSFRSHMLLHGSFPPSDWYFFAWMTSTFSKNTVTLNCVKQRTCDPAHVNMTLITWAERETQAEHARMKIGFTKGDKCHNPMRRVSYEVRVRMAKSNKMICHNLMSPLSYK